MEIERQGERTTITLGDDELRLLRYALERAGFIDTPATEQVAIVNFCAKVLEALPK